jgi:hypothetical protein
MSILKHSNNSKSILKHLIQNRKNQFEPEMYPLSSRPFGKSWEEWAALWCNWLLSIPKPISPALDTTGANCFHNQNNQNVWYLAGSFYNEKTIVRKCKIPKDRSIFFAILNKEDSFAEDLDLSTKEQLKDRAKRSMDKVIHLEASVNEIQLKNVYDYRIQSVYFDLIFPTDPVYDVKPGLTCSVVDGYFVFLKPFPPGNHKIHFAGELLISDDKVKKQLTRDSVYRPYWNKIKDSQRFKLDIAYDVDIDYR